MSELLIKHLVEIIRNPNTQISVRKLPSYLSCFINEGRDVVYIHNSICNAKEENLTCESLPTMSFDPDITGQPMEAPYSKFEFMDFSNTNQIFFEETESQYHSPLDLMEARSILSTCALKLKPSLPVWILTDGNDLKRTVLLSLELDRGWITRSWVSDRGLISALPTLENMKAHHAKFSSLPIHMFSCEVKCSYKIMKIMLDDDPSLLHSSITVHGSWTKMCLELPLLHSSAEIKIEVKVRIGHQVGGLKALWEQICLLDDYLNLLSRINADTCGVPIMTLPSSSAVMESLNKKPTSDAPVSRISSVLTQPVQSCPKQSSEPSLEQLINLYSYNDEPSASITDRLWLLFIECKNYQELSGCLKDFFLEIKQKNAPAPGVNNITRLGMALSGKEAVSIHDPIELLVEMGLEKLRKEMLLIISKAQIATVNSLNIPKFPHFSKVSSFDWLSTARKWHLWLCQVYCALTIFWYIQKYLEVPNITVHSIAPSILQLYVGEDSKIQSFSNLYENPLQEVEIVVPNKSVENAIKHMDPEEWAFSLMSSSKYMKFQSTFHKSPHNHFPLAVPKSKNDEEIKIPLGDVLFHWYEFGSISQYFSKDT